MKKILKLCLMTTVLASCGCIDAMATTTHTVTGAALDVGDGTAQAGAVMTVNSGHTVSNDRTFTTAGVYEEGVAIDVMAGSCSETSSGSGKIQAGALVGSGTIEGLVVRHHGGGALDWEKQDNAYVIAPTSLTTHGFISDTLTLTDAKEATDARNKFYEVIDSPENRLCRLYRVIVENENSGTMAAGEKLTSSDTAILSNLIYPGNGTPLAPTTNVKIGSESYQAYGNSGGGTKLGAIIYNSGSGTGYESVIANKEFKINLTADTGATSDSYSIDATLQNAGGSSATNSTEDITSLTVITTDGKTLSFTGENNFNGYDGTAAQKKVIALNIGDALTAGKVTFGGTANSDNGADVAMNGIGDVTVTKDGSSLTLEKGKSTTSLTTAGDWTFKGSSKLESNIPMEIAAGNKIIFGA